MNTQCNCYKCTVSSCQEQRLEMWAWTHIFPFYKFFFKSSLNLKPSLNLAPSLLSSFKCSMFALKQTQILLMRSSRSGEFSPCSCNFMLPAPVASKLLCAENENATSLIWGVNPPLAPPGFPGTRRSRTPGWGRWWAVPRRRRNPRSWGEQRSRRRRGWGLLHPGRGRWRNLFVVFYLSSADIKFWNRLPTETPLSFIWPCAAHSTSVFDAMGEVNISKSIFCV